ncbi:MAG: trypsin-like peptidase domain-containing protein [Pseudomonadales bacterium]|nr:trypsin-like peptidase domain-containing protein [Pseudomonadales bacterium]
MRINIRHCYIAFIAAFLLAASSALAAQESLARSPSVTPLEKNRLDPGCHLPDSRALSHIVQLRGDNGGHASGVVIRKNLLLTVAHAIAGENRVFADIHGELQETLPLIINESRDLALLQVDTGVLQPIAIAASPLSRHERVWAIGFPLGKNQRTSHGVLTDNENGLLYTTAHINQGTSGGGLLRCANGENNEYELAGIVRAYIADVTANQPINTGDSVAVGKAPILDLLHLADSSELSIAAMQLR